MIGLVLAHVVFSVWGYARQDGNSFLREYWNWLTLPQPGAATFGGARRVGATSPYPGIITATVGTALLLAVVVTSIVVVRRKLSYEWWYAVHFTVYAAIALSWFHMIPDGNEFVIDRIAADYWRSLFALALALVLFFRVARPLAQAARFDLRVTEVIARGAGRRLAPDRRAGPRAARRRGRASSSSGASSPEASGTRSIRSRSRRRRTATRSGSRSRPSATTPRGSARSRSAPASSPRARSGCSPPRERATPKALLIAGGIGITPVRALLEQMDGDVVVLYRVVSSDEIVFGDELDRIAAARGARVEYVVGDHRSPEARDLLSPSHLAELVPDIAERDVYVCGPPGMVDRIVPDLRAAGVPRRQLHVERFAL